MAPLLQKIAAAHGKSRAEFARVFAEAYPLCQNISIDYAVLEPRSAKGEEGSEIYCLPADFAWNDLGSWAALYEHRAGYKPGDPATENVSDGASTQSVVIDAQGNYVYALGKVVALIGVSDLVVVETTDALLITTRERSQDVGKVVAELKARGRYDLI
jgi:mannose-1-phosphate guanylyltransferase